MKTKDIKITVHGQTVTADATAALLSGSRNLYRLAFEFDEPAAAARYVQLEKAGVKSVYLPIDAEPIAVPNEFYETEGVILVSVFADDLITTNAATLPVIRSAYSAAVPAEGADEAGATHKCVFTTTDETAVTVLKKDAEGFKAFCGGEYVRVGSKNDYTDADKALVSLIPSKADEADLEDCIETVGEILRDKVDKVDGKGLSTNDYTDEDKSFLEETVPDQIDRIDAKIAEVEANVYSNFKNKVDKENGKGLSANDFTTELKDKLDGVEEGANKTAVDAELSATSENPVQNKAVKEALDKKIDKPTTVKEGLLGFNSAGVETVKEITDGGNAVETDTANIPNNKALKEYVAAKNGNFISKPTSNGIVGYMSGLGTLTYTLNTSMPASPTHSGVLTAKAVKDYTDEKSDTKVDKVDGKGLSTNDFTNAQKALVEKILETGYVKGLKEDINGLIQNVPGSNSNNVLYINTEVSATKSGIPLTQAVYAAIKDNETKLNKTTSLSADSTDTQYPTAKAVYDFIMALDASEVSY